MNRSSTTELKLAQFPTPCPPWCTVGKSGDRNVRHLEYEAFGEMPQKRIHTGPVFGAVAVLATEWLSAPGELIVRARVSIDGGSGPPDLRQLAADSIAAAQWIERETGSAPSGPRFVGCGELFHISRILPMLGLDEYEARGLVETGQLEASQIEGRTYVTGEAVVDYLLGRSNEAGQ